MKTNPTPDTVIPESTKREAWKLLLGHRAWPLEDHEEQAVERIAARLFQRDQQLAEARKGEREKTAAYLERAASVAHTEHLANVLAAHANAVRALPEED